MLTAMFGMIQGRIKASMVLKDFSEGVFFTEIPSARPGLAMSTLRKTGRGI
jgi:hypothetical protein